MSTTTQKLDPDVQKVLDDWYSDWRTPLKHAWQWNRSGVSEDLQKAGQLLPALASEFPNALPVWYERMFNLVKQGQRDEALRIFRDDVQPRFKQLLSIDTLCLVGRCYKDQADEHLAAGRLIAAEEAYADAERYYEQAYKKKLDRFPAINVATLRLLRASLLKQFYGSPVGRDTQSRDDPDAAGRRVAELILASRLLAGEVLACRPNWQVLLRDDEIWMTATEAEAYVLLADWPKAQEKYIAALRKENNPLAHHPDSMKAQLHRLVAAYARLGEPVPPPLNDPDSFFRSLFPTT
jgi:tetratricopeptide (TPR) repeat protein